MWGSLHATLLSTTRTLHSNKYPLPTHTHTHSSCPSGLRLCMGWGAARHIRPPMPSSQAPDGHHWGEARGPGAPGRPALWPCHIFPGRRAPSRGHMGSFRGLSEDRECSGSQGQGCEAGAAQGPTCPPETWGDRKYMDRGACRGAEARPTSAFSEVSGVTSPWCSWGRRPQRGVSPGLSPQNSLCVFIPQAPLPPPHSAPQAGPSFVGAPGTCAKARAPHGVHAG